MAILDCIVPVQMAETTKELNSGPSAMSRRFLNDILPDDDDHEKSSEDANLYMLLDEVSSSRKLMFSLFGTHNSVQGVAEWKQLTLNAKSSKIAKRWFLEENNSNTSVVSMALQTDSPVIFSWSSMAQDTVSPLSDADIIHSTISHETTNARLYKKVLQGLQQIKSDIEQDSKQDLRSPGERAFKTGSTFTVDPLEKFVATKLPKSASHTAKDKKKKKECSHKSKRSSLLWFWSGSKKKHSIETNKVISASDDVPAANTATSTKDITPTKDIASNSDVLPIKDLLDGNSDVDEYGEFERASPSPSHKDEDMSITSFVPLQPTKKGIHKA